MPIYVQFPGINGNVRNLSGLPGQGWIEISSFQFGVGRGISSPTGGSSDRESSSPSVSEIVVTKPPDIASPSLFNHCLGGPSGPVKKLGVSIVFTNAVPGGPRHTLH